MPGHALPGPGQQKWGVLPEMSEIATFSQKEGRKMAPFEKKCSKVTPQKK